MLRVTQHHDGRSCLIPKSKLFPCSSLIEEKVQIEDVSLASSLNIELEFVVRIGRQEKEIEGWIQIGKGSKTNLYLQMP